MKKEKIIELIDELKQKIEELENEVNSPEFEGNKKGVRQMPIRGDRYWYVDSDGIVTQAKWRDKETDLFRFNTGNCFKTEQEAKDYKENLLTKQQLKDLALELNEGVEIDWKNDRELKHYLYIDHDINLLTTEYAVISQENIVYCLNDQFLEIAKERIGEEKIIKLIKSGV